MNLPPPNADELVSAYLDGEATSDEIATVESSPELMRRVQTMREISEHLDAPLSAPTEQKEAHIAAALGAFDAMFNAENGAPTGQGTQPILVVASEPAIDEQPSVESSPGLTSLAAARERRRPRRFNTGIIAAAAAAILLFVAVAALSFGRGTDSTDIATSSVDAAIASDDTADDAAGDAAAPVEEARAEQARDQDEAESGVASSALIEQSEPEAASIAEAPAAVQADAADSDGGLDEEQAVEELVEAEADEMNTAEAAPFVDAFFVGVFLDQEAFLLELSSMTSDDFTTRSRFFEPGSFPGCQKEIAELAELDRPTLVGEAMVADEAVEVHLVSTDDDGISLVIVDANDCSILSTLP